VLKVEVKTELEEDRDQLKNEVRFFFDSAVSDFEALSFS
jgi:hypothetical protein